MFLNSEASDCCLNILFRKRIASLTFLQEISLREALGNASLRRKQASKMREVKQGIRRFDKLMRSVSDFQTALKLMISEVSNVQAAILVLGASPLRPQQVYEVSFLHGKSVPVGPPDFAKSRAADALSRKVHPC